MQSKLIKSGLLLKDNFIFLELKSINIEINKLFTGEPLNIYFEEVLSSNKYVSLIENTIEQAEKAALNLTIKELNDSKYIILNEIKKIYNNKFLSLFLLPKDINKIKLFNQRVVEIDNLLNNTTELSKKISINIVKFNDEKLIKTPFHQLEKNEYVYVVVQDFEKYLQIKKAQVKSKNIKIVKGSTDYNTDYEFDYTVESENKDLIIDIIHYNFVGFDGYKCKINDYIIFKNIEDAKKHCLLVLKDLNKKILDIIEDINNH